MQILIILLVLLLLSALLPLLLPILAVAAVVVLALNLRRVFGRGGYNRFEKTEDPRIFERRDSAASGGETDPAEEAGGPVAKIPASVRDDRFWEQEHTVYDVPYEEAGLAPDEDDPDQN